uniref:RWD domain-containing protein 2B-like n=1 Tax=Phallusia mammillata TaxID=59560 RepID=A0A6F9DSG4_9ASCI|nr:RWD domain-containing protein 2B-like [Phallusia mammillata]
MVEVVEMQLSEVDVLQSIFPNDNEVVIEDLVTYATMKRYVETNGKSAKPSKMLPLKLNLTSEEPRCVIEMKTSLPLHYPIDEMPEVFLRCDKMTRNVQQKFNEDLSDFKSTLEMGEICLYQIAQWALDNIHHYLKITDTDDTDEISSLQPTDNATFTRLWIYSHHIYNKEKRKCILEWAKELQLTGFSMPGKPGVVCVEGLQENCEEYWQRLRRQTWKRLTIAHRMDETSTEENKKTLESFRKFHTTVAEMDFGVHGGRDYHMDLGKFLQYLTDHDSKPIFEILFGVQGTTKT